MSDLPIIDSIDFNSESNSTVCNLAIPSDLFLEVQDICLRYGSDIRIEVVELLKCYVIAYQQFRIDPVTTVLLDKIKEQP